MKAREYAALIMQKHAAGADIADVLTDVILAMIDECGALIKARNCRVDSACAAVFVEMNVRWVAACKLLPLSVIGKTMTDGLFYRALEAVMPQTYAALSALGVFR